MPSANARYGTPKPPQETDPFDGVLLVNKPAGPTSHDIVDKIRRTFKIRKVGHGGTLDPGATGLLILNAAAGWAVLLAILIRFVVAGGKMLDRSPLTVMAAGFIAGDALWSFGSAVFRM